MKSVHVLLVYGLDEQKLIAEQRFDNSRDAQVAYVDAERDHFLDSSVEIVLIASDSIETIKHTHASYFSEDVSLSALDLEGLMPA